MWVKRITLHLIDDSRIQKKLISIDVIKRLKFLKKPHSHPTGWAGDEGSMLVSNVVCLTTSIFCRKLMPSTSNDMINNGFHTNSKWVTRFGCICRKSTSQDPIGSFVHFDMGLTPSPRLWVTMLLNWVFPASLAYTRYSMWTSFAHTFHYCWTHRR